jgi:predicted ribonuclease YlaK
LPSAKVKTFVLDTNVLLHDPQSIFKFEDNNLAIPVEVLEELDAIKGEQSTERGRNARRVHRILQELLPDSRAMLEGVRLSTGGTLSVIINRYLLENRQDTPAMLRLRAVLPDLSKKDNRIIACALFVQEQYPPPTILVTKDVNVQLKARAVGLESEDYLNDKVNPEEVSNYSNKRIPVDHHSEFTRLRQSCREAVDRVFRFLNRISHLINGFASIIRSLCHILKRCNRSGAAGCQRLQILRHRVHRRMRLLCRLRE